MKTRQLLVAFLSLIFVAANAAEPLKLNLEKDKVYKVLTKSETNITQSMNGMDMNITNNSTNKVSFSVLGKDQGIMIVKVTFDSTVSEVNMPGRSMNSNSTKPGNPKNPEEFMSNAFYKLSQNPLEVKLNSAGKVLEITNSKAVISEVMKALDSLPQASQMQMRPMLEMMFNEAGLKSMVEMITSYFPENNEADSWNNKFVFSAQGMNLEIKGKYIVKERNGNIVTISGESTVEPSGDGKMKMMGMDAILDMRGMGNGEFTVDAATGWIIKGKSKQRMQGSVTVNGTNIPMQIESKSDVVKVE